MKSKTKVEAEEEYNPERMQRLPRGSFRERHPDYDPATAEKKVRVTIYLDADLLDYFKRRAAAPNAAPYQTQINSELRAVMERSGGAPYDALLSDERFIEAVAEKVRQRA
ncbi:MAG TPA: BrnA antitoxin family protein [Pyrinomonadaceae bacterium]